MLTETQKEGIGGAITLMTAATMLDLVLNSGFEMTTEQLDNAKTQGAAFLETIPEKMELLHATLIEMKDTFAEFRNA